MRRWNHEGMRTRRQGQRTAHRPRMGIPQRMAVARGREDLPGLLLRSRYFRHP